MVSNLCWSDTGKCDVSMLVHECSYTMICDVNMILLCFSVVLSSHIIGVADDGRCNAMCGECAGDNQQDV